MGDWLKGYGGISFTITMAILTVGILYGSNTSQIAQLKYENVELKVQIQKMFDKQDAAFARLESLQEQVVLINYKLAELQRTQK